MKAIVPICLLTAVLFFSACVKEETVAITPAPGDPATELLQFRDSCSYIVDGVVYTCNQGGSFMRSVGGAKLDTLTKTWSNDTSLYFTRFKLLDNINSPVVNDGYLSVTFIKKYGKNQLNTLKPISIYGPQSELELYEKGKHPYTTDFNRLNNQNGVALELMYGDRANKKFLQTFPEGPWGIPTQTPSNFQNNSYFEVTNVKRLSNGVHVVEAKFEANGLTTGEQVKRIEKGYVRFQVWGW